MIRNELKVGIFILIPVIIIFLLVILKLGYSIASSTIDVYLKVDSISAIKKGTPIMMKGYAIGRLADIKPVYKPDLHFLATMRLQRNIDLDQDCTAVILNQNVIGDAVVEIKNPEKRTATIRPGDVIEGLEYVNLESLLQNINGMVSKVSSAISEFQNLPLDNRNNLRNMVADLGKGISSLSRVLQNSETDIVTTLSDLRKTASTLFDISKELKKHPVKFLFQDKNK